MNMPEYMICTKCVMDTSDPRIEFDSDGVCSHCHRSKRELARRVVAGKEGEKRFSQLMEVIRKSRGNREYDSILGISGGVDSSYLALKCVQAGLRPLAVHFDSGWNSEVSVKNIESLVKTLGIDLFTVVCDWREMKDLQRAFFRASVVNCDIPQDHAFIAVLWRLAAKHGIKYIISGHNVNTESVLPVSYRGYSSHDWAHIRDIQKRFGTLKLRRYPHVGFWGQMWYKYFSGFRVVTPLDYLDYSKTAACKYLEQEVGWRVYRGKHGESRFTKFFQGYYLPEKFSIDKRRAHLSALINSGQVTREDALCELELPFYSDPMELKEDKGFILKKLGIDDEEWDEIMTRPIRTERDYASNRRLYASERRIIEGAGRLAKRMFPQRLRTWMQQRFMQAFKT